MLFLNWLPTVEAQIFTSRPVVNPKWMTGLSLVDPHNIRNIFFPVSLNATFGVLAENGSGLSHKEVRTTT